METVSEENKGLIWGLLKQLRPGMDLSKVVLPTFILEPRSFLDKLSDYYYHADLLSQSVTYSQMVARIYYLPLFLLITVRVICHHLSCHRAALEESAYGRIKQVLRWYLSGFYKKPKVQVVYCEPECSVMS